MIKRISILAATTVAAGVLSIAPAQAGLSYPGGTTVSYPKPDQTTCVYTVIKPRNRFVKRYPVLDCTPVWPN